MNLLTINSYDCSPVASGGVNRITDILSRQFTARGINCFLGYFEPQPANIELTPFVDRIQLSHNFDREAFKAFLTKNHIDIVQVNFLKKENLVTMPILYKCAHECGAKVIYAFHMCPGFQTVTYGSWRMVRFCISKRKNVMRETKKWIITILRPFIRLIEPYLLREKYLMPYNNCDQIVLLSQHYFTPYLRLAGVKKSSKMRAIPNALRFAESATAEDIQNKQPIALVVARFEEDTKRLSIVLKAWREIEKDERFNEWRLQLVGDGRDIDFYKHLVNDWGLQRVEFTGQQNPQEYYRKASLFLMTSTAEGWPLVLLESSQMGVPAVAMGTFGSLYDIVTPGKEGIITSSDIADFTKQWKEIMADDERRKQMILNTVKKSQSFTSEIVNAKWMELFNKIAGQ